MFWYTYVCSFRMCLLWIQLFYQTQTKGDINISAVWKGVFLAQEMNLSLPRLIKKKTSNCYFFWILNKV